MTTMNVIGAIRKSSGIALGVTALLWATPAPACPPEEGAGEKTTQAAAQTVTAWAMDGTGNVFLTGADGRQANVFVTALPGADDDELLRDVDARTMEISVADGTVTVRINGKEVPADRIRHEKGRIVVLDRDGKEIETIRLGMPTHDMFEPGNDLPFGVGGVLPGPGEPLDLVELEEPRVMLGILLDEPGPALRQHFDLEPGTTTMISALYKGLPAHAAGLDQYDIIVEIEGEVPADPASLRRALADREPGDEIELTVVHRGRTKRVEIELKAFDREAMAKAEMIGQAPQATVQFDQFFGGGPRGIDITTEIPGMNEFRFGPGEGGRRLFVTPKQDIFELAPRPLPRPRAGTGGGGEEVLDDRLQRLDRRLAELEEMLDALLQRASERTKEGGSGR